MPIGCCAVVPHVAMELAQRRPARVLDLGMGSGFYGAVARQWLDLGARPWRTFLAGVEVWADYRNPLWDLYDVVFVDTIQGFLAERAETYDCVLFNDVLEHFEAAEGESLIGQVKGLVAPGGLLIVSTPAVFFAQGAENGNPFETHRSAWTARRLESLGFRTILSGQEPQTAFVPAVLSYWP